MKTTVKITQINTFKSNTEIYGVNRKDGLDYYFHVAHDNISVRARNKGGDTLKRACINKLREERNDLRIVCRI